MIYSDKTYQIDLLKKGFFQNRNSNGKNYNYDLMLDHIRADRGKYNGF